MRYRSNRPSGLPPTLEIFVPSGSFVVHLKCIEFDLGRNKRKGDIE
jgi:hypothetical protein